MNTRRSPRAAATPALIALPLPWFHGSRTSLAWGHPRMCAATTSAVPSWLPSSTMSSSTFGASPNSRRNAGRVRTSRSASLNAGMINVTVVESDRQIAESNCRVLTRMLTPPKSPPPTPRCRARCVRALRRRTHGSRPEMPRKPCREASPGHRQPSRPRELDSRQSRSPARTGGCRRTRPSHRHRLEDRPLRRARDCVHLDLVRTRTKERRGERDEVVALRS